MSGLRRCPFPLDFQGRVQYHSPFVEAERAALGSDRDVKEDEPPV